MYKRQGLQGSLELVAGHETAGDVLEGAVAHLVQPVSYTHLDVYKRQGGTLGSYRAVSVTDPAGNTLVSGLSANEALGTVNRLITIMSLVGLSGIALVVLGGSWLVRRNLAPLERVAAIAGRVSRTPLSSGEVEISERVPDRDTDVRTEVGQVGAALNELCLLYTSRCV